MQMPKSDSKLSPKPPTTRITFITALDKRQELDEIATACERNLSYIINEAIENYLDYQHWRKQEIKTGLAQSKAGLCVPEEEVNAFFDTLRQPE